MGEKRNRNLVGLSEEAWEIIEISIDTWATRAKDGAPDKIGGVQIPYTMPEFHIELALEYYLLSEAPQTKALSHDERYAMAVAQALRNLGLVRF